MKRIALATLAVLALGIVPASAANWTGCYGGVVGSYNARVVGDTWGSEGPGVGVVAGCDIQLQKFVVGGWGQYDWRRFEWKPFGASIDIDVDGWAAGGRAGYLVTPDALAYALVGYTDLNMSGGPAANGDGLVVGGGAEFSLGDGLFLRTEYQHATLDVSGTAMDPNIHSGRVGVLYRLNWDTNPLK